MSPGTATSSYITPPSSTKKPTSPAMVTTPPSTASHTPPLTLPRAPDPSSDPGSHPAPSSDEPALSLPALLDSTAPIDIFTLPPLSALYLLVHCIEHLVELTGDIPPTPPINLGQPPQADPSEEAIHISPAASPSHKGPSSPTPLSPTSPTDGPLYRTPIGSPEAHHEPFPIIGEHTSSPRVQLDAITRKFYSKRPPPISLAAYLSRLHKYCPMSTAVYLAVSLYVWRLAIVERKLPVTRRNAHRLLLAGLRVGMKALEDRSWHHERFARVGGVSERELARLEISFCFVTGFELKVDAQALTKQAEELRDFARAQGNEEMTLKLPVRRRVSLGGNGS
ncbi:MAG: hypothetical protein M1814_002075 [Vezdaea aestivalis]|nr:MAG: hypothetical protein M1814_002075 [Vezdaea aestivalis]